MSNVLIDLTGKKYNHLTVLKRVGTYTSPHGAKQPIWLCKCDCGNETSVTAANLRNGTTKSCGCITHESISKNAININLAETGLNSRSRFEGTIIDSLTAKAKKNNPTGIRGVIFDQSRQKYRANIMLRGKSYFLGRYNTLKEAETARKIAEDELYKPIIEQYIQERKMENV